MLMISDLSLAIDFRRSAFSKLPRVSLYF